jgi:hypothetical protein
MREEVAELKLKEESVVEVEGAHKISQKIDSMIAEINQEVAKTTPTDTTWKDQKDESATKKKT